MHLSRPHFTQKQFPIFRILVSETSLGSPVLQLPEASRKDKDAGWLALVRVHVDTDLNGPTGTRNHQTGTAHHEATVQ